MTTDPVPPRRRRRRAVWRAGSGITRTEDVPPAPPAPMPVPVPVPVRAVTPDVDDPAADAETPAEVAVDAPADARPKRRRSDPSERGLRDLVGAGPSQLGPVRAMRVRDVNRPSAEDLAEADQDVVIVRRHWKPPSA